MKIPVQYLPAMPYLILPEAEEFLEFSKKVFQGTEQLIVRTADHKIMHGELKIGPAVIMFSSGSNNWTEKTGAVYIYVDDVNAVYKRAIENRAKSLEVPQKKDYGYSAGFEDPFGNFWFIVQAD